MANRNLKCYICTILLYIAIMTTLIFLTACSSTKEPIRVITQYELKPITIPSIFMVPCKVTRPPDKNQYILQDWGNKENILTNYTIALLTDLKLCNEQLATIKKLHAEQIKILKGRVIKDE